MKIGILTQPLQNNYGGLLQNYALQQVLKRMGHEVETVDWYYAKPGVIKEFLLKAREKLLDYVHKTRRSHNYQLSNKEEAIIGKNTRRFVDKYLTVSSEKACHYRDFEKIEARKLYDAYVVGSDQVWRPMYNYGVLTAMFLDFCNRPYVKRIAYAASFGTSDWEFSLEQTKDCSLLAKKFDLVSVREATGVGLCMNNLGVDAIHVLDPTMLLEKEDYEEIVLAEHEPKSKGTLFHYILDLSDEKRALIESVSEYMGLVPFSVMPKYQSGNRTKQAVKRHIEDCVFPPVTLWLRGFMDAKMVIVDSFHGAVFSIIFNKPFWVLSNKKRGNARFESLLGMFRLKDRMISTDDRLDWDRRIDWALVNSIRDENKEKCIQLLKDILTNK
jgi:hypothetical protein